MLAVKSTSIILGKNSESSRLTVLPSGTGTRLPLLLVDVVPILDGAHGGRVGGGPADALRFERLYEARLGVARRGAGEVLARVEVLEVEDIALFHVGQVGLLVSPAFDLVDPREAVEEHLRSPGDEGVAVGAISAALRCSFSRAIWDATNRRHISS